MSENYSTMRVTNIHLETSLLSIFMFVRRRVQGVESSVYKDFPKENVILIQLKKLMIRQSMVKISLAYSVFYFQLFDKSYRQVLTPVNNSQLLLKLAILDKFRLATFHGMTTQKKLQYKTGLHWFRRNESSRDLDS
jgi:hypothetical protein